MSRNLQFEQWLAQHYAGRRFAFAPASEDASFRRYLRVTPETGPTVILMDAPPEREDCRPYVEVARLFGAAGVHVPEVLAADLENGYLLLSDLGTRTYLQALQDKRSASALYDDATDALVRIQLASRPGVLPPYDRTLLLREMRLFPDWYIARHLGVTLTPSLNQALDLVFERILANNLAQPCVYVHRDYHSRNLMVTTPNPGILDFQDAVYGPITYDLVSLLKDAYVSWEEATILDWAVRYWEKARKAGLPLASDFAAFYRDFEWMGAQRHIKVLGIFARLFHRDGKNGYLKDMPLVLRYLRQACERYGELHPLLRLLDQLEHRQPSTGYTF
ncbi:MAG TPA: phosphotransferase [Burkholderiales bacterium]|nr:phosphotransferase [Burkholderiales bacterium]